MNILAACSGKDTTVRKFIFKSSTHYYGSEQDDPAFFTEAMRRPHPPRTPIERDIVEAEAAITDFSEKQPDTCVTILRCPNVLGPDVETPLRRLASLPFVPGILGFDPRLQFVHEDDVADALLHATAARPARRLQRRGRRRARAQRDRGPARQAVPAVPAAVGDGPCARRRCAGSA